VGALLGWVATVRSRFSAGFAALGAVAGLFLGISSTPVLSTTITAAFTLIGVLIPVYFPKKTEPGVVETAPPSVAEWLFPFAVALAAGALVGITLRVNDSLNFASVSLKDHYSRLGFDEAQVKAIVDRQAKTVAGESVTPSLSAQYKALGFSDEQVKAIMERQAKTIVIDPGAGAAAPKLAALDPVPVKPQPYLQGHGDAINLKELWKDAVRADDTAENNLSRIKGAVDPVLKGRIEEVEKSLGARGALERIKGDWDI
jgi:hypothetical protein